MNEYYIAKGEVVAQKMFGLKGNITPGKEETLKTNGGMMYYEFDGLGSVIGLNNRHGEKIEDYRYDVFGNLQTGITSPYNIKGYTGHSYDDISSLVYMNARWYNPSSGRFMQKDTYRGNLSTPQSLNQYAYVMNSPMNYTDPTGNIPEPKGRSRADLDDINDGLSRDWYDARDKRNAAETPEEYSMYQAKMDRYHSRANSNRNRMGWTDETKITGYGPKRQTNKAVYDDYITYT